MITNNFNDVSPKVTVIMPCYNASSFINDSIDSVLNQSFNNFELIIINDGSTDDSEVKILNYSDNRIRYFYQSNKGQCSASNFGISVAKGKFIKFLDADDILNSNHLEAQYNKVKNSSNTIASCKWGRFYENNYENARFIPELVWKDLKSIDWLRISLAQRHDMMGAWLWLIPKEILNKVGGWNESLSLNNDFEFSVRLLLGAEKVLFADEAILFYRTGNSDSLANSISLNSFKSAYESNLLGCNFLISSDNSQAMKLLCANRFQEWVFAIYPNHKEVVNKFELKIKEWGGSSIRLEGGMLLKILEKLFGWKTAVTIKNSLNNLFKR